MEICIVFGTRPEIIKISPIFSYLEENSISFFVIHTNQHYSKELDEIFFNELNIPKPDYNLNVGSLDHGAQIGRMLERIEKILINKRPDIVLVQGDTNSTLAGALSASKLNIKIAHIEAGLRSYDRQMPEEINRILVDHMSDYLFVPTQDQYKILISEGIESKQIYEVGNTIVDAIKRNIKISSKKSKIINNLTMKPHAYVLMTLHRPSNTDNKEHLISILEAVSDLYSEFNIPILLPIHPRTTKMISKFDVKIGSGIIIIQPVGYIDMLHLISNAKLIITDSGGLQEEACILGVPTITIRENTERPETVKIGANILVGHEGKFIIEAFKNQIEHQKKWVQPYGENVVHKIMKILSC